MSNQEITITFTRDELAALVDRNPHAYNQLNGYGQRAVKDSTTEGYYDGWEKIITAVEENV